jgi:hypothetical protein
MAIAAFAGMRTNTQVLRRMTNKELGAVDVEVERNPSNNPLGIVQVFCSFDESDKAVVPVLVRNVNGENIVVVVQQFIRIALLVLVYTTKLDVYGRRAKS